MRLLFLKKNPKAAFLLVFLFLIIGSFCFSVKKAEASSCASNGTGGGSWNSGSTWTSCASGVPLVNDTVTIAATDTVTMDVASAVLGGVTINGILNTSAAGCGGTSCALSSTTITINLGGTLTANASTITISGVNGAPFVNSGTFTAGSSTVTYNGNNLSGTTTLAATPYFNLITNNISENFFLGTDTVSGVWNATSGVVDLSGNLTLSGTAGTLWSCGGTCRSNGNTVFVTATSGSPTIGTGFSGGSAFYDLTISGASTAKNISNFTVSDVLTLSSGPLTLGAGSSMTLSGNTGTPFVNNGTFTFANGFTTVTYSGANVSGNTTVLALAYGNLTLSGADTYTMAANTVSNILTVGATSTLSISGQLTLSGTANTLFVNNGNTTGFLANSNTVLVNAASGTPTITSGTFTGAAAFYNLTINGNSTSKTLGVGNSVTVSNVLTESGSPFALGTNTSLTLSGTTGTPFSYVSGTFSGTAGSTVTYSGVRSGGGNTTVASVSYNNLTLSGATTYASGINTVSGALTVSSGATLSLSGQLTLSGSSGTLFTNNAGTTGFLANGNTVLVNTAAASTPTILAGTFTGAAALYNLTVVNPSTGKTLASGISVTITNVLTETSGPLALGTNTSLTLSGNIAIPFVYTAGTFTASAGSTVTYSGNNGVGNTTVVAQPYVNLTLSGAETYTMAANTVSGALNISNASGSLSLSGTLTLSGTSGTLFTNSGTFTANSNIVQATSTSGTPILNSGTFTGSSAFYNLTISGLGGNKTLGANTTVSNVLAVSSGTLDASSFTLTLSGVTGTPFTTGGTFTASTSTVSYTGNAGAVPGTTIATATYNNLTLNQASTTFKLSPSTTVGGALTVTAGIFSLNGSTLVLSGTTGTLFTNSGTFTAGTATVSVTSTSGTPTLTSGTFTGSSAFYDLTISGVGGNKTLGADTTVSHILTVSSGTLGGGSYTLNLSGIGTVFSNSGTYTAGTSTIKLTDASSSAKTFAGGGGTFNNLWLAPGSGTGAYTISGDNTFNDFKDDGTAAHSILFTAGTTQHVTTFTVHTSGSNLITLDSTTTATFALVKDGGGTILRDYLDIQHSVATPSSTWYAGANSVNHQSTITAGSGWLFIPDAPTSLVATPGNTLISLSWSDPNNSGAVVTDYVIEYKLTSDSIWSIFADGVSTAMTTTVTGLTNGLSYDSRVSAVNLAGQGSPSGTATATPATVPDAPTIGTATSGNAQATVTFTAPVSDGGSTITSYTVTSSPGGFTGTGSGSPIVVTGLTNGSTYTFTVTATNIMGTGVASNASNSVIPATVPNAPTALSATAGNAQISLLWSAPAYDGGSAITDYIIDYKLTSEPTIWSTFSDGISTSTSGIVTGLTNGLSYDFRVSAVNVAGQGSTSFTVTEIPVTVPDAPTIGTATRGNAQATVTFTAPVSDGGSTITSYTVTSSPGGFTGTGSGSPIVVTGLTNGSTYTFTVTATNFVGTGSASSVSNSVTPATVPDAPTGVSAVGENAQATVTFSAPAFDGGTAITSYTVTSSPGGFTGTGSGSPIVVTGLTNGSTYTFTVTATNNVGTGSDSSAFSPVTLPTEPGIPVNLASTVLGSSIGLSWSPPVSDGGSAITDYVIEYQLTTGGVWSVFSDGTSTGTVATVTGLSNGTSYDFRVSAVNMIGQGLSSTSVTAIPGEPAQVLIQSFSDVTSPSISTAVRITNEGSVQYEYQYTWCVTDASSNLCGGGDDVFSSSAAKLIQPGEDWDTTLNSTVPIPGNYWFHISVVYGSDSSTANQSFTAVATYPDAPTIGTATSGNAQATVTFTAPVSDGGTAITSYTVTSSPGGFTGTGSGSPIVVTGLTNGSTYTFTVTATNNVGTGPTSSFSNSVIPATVPDAPTGVSAVAGNMRVVLSWIAPSNNGGSAITDYIIDYKLTSEPTIWSTFSDGFSTATTATVIGLTNNVSYDFRVSAVNAIGQSAVNSTTATATAASHGSSGGGYTTTYEQSQTPTQLVPANPTTSIPIATSDTTNFKNTPVVVSPTLPSINKNEVTATPTEPQAIVIVSVNKIINGGGTRLWVWVTAGVLAGLVISGGFAYTLFIRRRRASARKRIEKIELGKRPRI